MAQALVADMLCCLLGGHQGEARVALWLSVCAMMQAEALLQALGFESHLSHFLHAPHFSLSIFTDPKTAETICYVKLCLSTRKALRKCIFSIFLIVFESVVRFLSLK